MWCLNCNNQKGKKTLAKKSREPGQKLITCTECGNQIRLSNNFRGELVIQERTPTREPVDEAETQWHAPDDPTYFNFFVNEYLCDEGTDILVYSEGEYWVIPKGIGKSHSVMRAMMEIARYGETELYMNIPFIDNRFPPGVHYAEELGEVLYDAFGILLREPGKRFMLVVDEWAQFMNQYEFNRDYGQVVAKLLDLTRKLGINLIAICPNLNSFPIQLRRNNMMHLVKSADRILQLRSREGRTDIHPESILFVEGSSRLGWVNTPFEIGQCDWTRDGGKFQYDHRGAGDFSVSPWLVEHRRDLVQCLKRTGTEKVRAVHELLGKYYSPEARKRRGEEEGSGFKLNDRQMMKAAITFLVKKMMKGNDIMEVQCLGPDGITKAGMEKARLTPAAISRITGGSSTLVANIVKKLQAEEEGSAGGEKRPRKAGDDKPPVAPEKES